MNLLAALKIFCDLTLPASAASVVIPWFSLIPGNYLPAMLCCAAGILLAALLQKRAALRFAGAVPCLCALSFCDSRVDAVVVIPMIVYCLWIIAQEAFTVSYDEYRDFFKNGAVFHGACFLFASVNIDWGKMMPYAVLYFVVAVFLLRNLRLGAAGSKRNMALNFVAFAGAVTLGLVLCVVVYTILRLLLYPAAAIYFGVMDGFLEVSREALYFIGEILTYLVTYIVMLLYQRRNGEIEVDGGGNGEVPPAPSIEPNETVNTVAGTILILIAAGAVIFFARKAAKMMKKRIAAGRRVTMERLDAIGGRHGAKVTGNRAKVRAVYRKFMGLVVERGEEIRIDHTSEDVMHLGSLVADGRACAELREVYLSARYDTTREVTGEQVKEAKNLYKKLQDK